MDQAEDHNRKAAEAHGNLDAWQRAENRYQRWWLERYTRDQIHEFARLVPDELVSRDRESA